MLKKAWHDPVWSKIIASAIIGILTTGIAFWLHHTQPAEVSKRNPNNDEVSQGRTNDGATQQKGKDVVIRLGDAVVVREHKAFVDPKTGFVFSIDEIFSGWGPLRSYGVLGFYILPDGRKGDFHRYPVGDRVLFEFGGRKFAFVIVDIDYKSQAATFRVDEFVSATDQKTSPWVKQ